MKTFLAMPTNPFKQQGSVFLQLDVRAPVSHTILNSLDDLRLPASFTPTKFKFFVF